MQSCLDSCDILRIFWFLSCINERWDILTHIVSHARTSCQGCFDYKRDIHLVTDQCIHCRLDYTVDIDLLGGRSRSGHTHLFNKILDILCFQDSGFFLEIRSYISYRRTEHPDNQDMAICMYHRAHLEQQPRIPPHSSVAPHMYLI